MTPKKAKPYLRIALIASTALLAMVMSGCSEFDHVDDEGVESERFINIDTGKPVPSGMGLSSERIIVDTETGVEYLWIRTGYAAGLTPLLNADGTPIVAEGYVSNE